ncbi:MAG TPA: hypothetical protein VF812_07765 [Ktedonobacterales bacterium]
MNGISAWLGGLLGVDRKRGVRNVGAVETYATETRVVLADGRIMHVRNASLAAAKDLLAAQRAIERRVAAQRQERLARDGARGIGQADKAGVR